MGSYIFILVAVWTPCRMILRLISRYKTLEWNLFLYVVFFIKIAVGFGGYVE